MRARNVMLTLVLLVVLFLFAVFKNWHGTLSGEAFHRAPGRLQFYAFARCRMRCLTVTDEDIKAIMQTGVINLNRSRWTFRPCPLFAVQGRVRNQYLRVLFEQCRNATYVVNCYNLNRDTTCDCPTDYQPKQR